jgi:hypothetical protein
MKQPRFTIGMATCDDYEGVWATVQSVFLHNDWDHPDDVQIVVVDTSPQGSDHRALVKDFLAKGGHDAAGSRTSNIKYVDMAGYAGTTKPRDVIFDHADGEFVCVMDCHVMLRSNTLRKLLDWFESNRDCTDLIHGPILYDNLHMFSTHFDDQFRGGMWGTWGSAWRAADTGELFVVQGEEVTDENRKRESTRMAGYDLMTLKPLATHEAMQLQMTPDGVLLPACDWPGHERVLASHRFIEAGRDDGGKPFEIPGQGMGLFASRKDSWLGFAKECSGFGGEEMNIHVKYRQAGRNAICLPFLKWNHRFGRAGGAPYPIPLSAKIRNYVLWAKELNLPLDRIHTHFVASGQFPQEAWERLIADPVGYHVELKSTPRNSGHAPLDYLFLQTAMTARDLKEHAETIKSISSKVESVAAFVKRADWEPLIAAGFPKTIDIYQSEDLPLVDQTHEAVKQQHVKDSRQIHTYRTLREKNGDKVEPLEVDKIAPVDLLVIDKVNSAEYLAQVLARHGESVERYILVRGTQAFGEKAESDNAQPGLFYGMKDWIGSHPDWFVLQHWPNQYGLTLLAKEPHPRPEKEVRPWPKGYGPGTELKAILASVGINPSPTCDCNAYMRQMDEWGISECVERHAEIVQRLREKADQWGWNNFITKKAEGDAETHQFTLAEKIKIGWKSITTGIAFKVNWLDPYPDLVEEAIKRAEVKCTKECQKNGCEKPGCRRKEVAA